MTKSLKELILVFLFGTALLLIIWGVFHQVNLSLLPGKPRWEHQIAWAPIWWGIILIVLGNAFAVFVRPSK